MLQRTNFITLANGQRFYPLLNPGKYKNPHRGNPTRAFTEASVETRKASYTSGRSFGK